MAKRRSLTDSLKAAKIDPKKEKEFVYRRYKAEEEEPQQEAPKSRGKQKAAPILDPDPGPTPEQPLGRSSFTTRLRTDIAVALKRASLERQLAGQTPYTVQDIVELNLEPWLKAHGYLK
jgi:hypothetical protein